MYPKMVKQVLSDALNADGARVNLYLWGAAGIGKSAITKQAAEENHVDFIDVRASQLDPTDVRGIIVPNMVTKIAEWLIPVWLPQNEDWRGVVMLDELNLAPILVQSACYQLIWDRCLGDYELPKGAMIVAAGNRKKDGAPTHNMAAPLRNRFAHITVEPSIKDWNEWAMIMSINPDVIAFVNFKSEVFAPEFKASVEEQAFPSPRTWEFVSRLLAINPNTGRHYYSQHPDSIRELIAGCVGVGAATEFQTYQRIREKLPDIDAILQGTFPAKKITQPDILYALMTTLAVKVLEIPTANRPAAYGNLLGFLDSKIESAEFHTLCITLVGAKDRENLCKAPAWGKWIKKYKDVFLEKTGGN